MFAGPRPWGDRLCPWMRCQWWSSSHPFLSPVPALPLREALEDRWPEGPGSQEGWAKAVQGAAQPRGGAQVSGSVVCGLWAGPPGGDVSLAARPLASQSIQVSNCNLPWATQNRGAGLPSSCRTRSQGLLTPHSPDPSSLPLTCRGQFLSQSPLKATSAGTPPPPASPSTTHLSFLSPEEGGWSPAGPQSGRFGSGLRCPPPAAPGPRSPAP